MKPGTILMIKFITAVVAFAIGLDLFFDATFVDILSFSLFVTIVSYVVGEMIVLPRLGNRAAMIVDFLITYTSVWIFGGIVLESYMQVAWGSFISAILIAASEVVVHRYSTREIPAPVKTSSQRSFHRIPAYDTEFAEEHDAEDQNKLK